MNEFNVDEEARMRMPEAAPESVWENKRISDLRRAMQHRDMDTSCLDSFLETVGEPLVSCKKRGRPPGTSHPTKGVPEEVLAMSAAALRVRAHMCPCA